MFFSRERNAHNKSSKAFKRSKEYYIMPKHFMKTKSCGCVIKVTSVGIKKENNKDLYLIGGHRHIKICENCKQDEINGIDTLYNISDDDITDGSGNDGWIEYSYDVCKTAFEMFKK